jgi:hypothetical protein
VLVCCIFDNIVVIYASICGCIFRCRQFDKLDDQTNLFDELNSKWIPDGRAERCEGREGDLTPLDAFTWTTDAPARTAPGTPFSPMRVCPLPRLTFATGYAALHTDLWRQELKNAGDIFPVVVHFNCLGGSAKAGAKRWHTEALGLWIYDDGRLAECAVCTALPPPGTCRTPEWPKPGKPVPGKNVTL